MSDLSWEMSSEEAMNAFNKGDMVRATVLDIDIDKERISLGIKQLENDPFANAKSLKRGNTVTCSVIRVMDAGLEVETSDGLTGFIRKGDLSRDRSEQRPDRYAVGDKLDANVISVDNKTRKVNLSVKALEISEEKEAVANYGSSDSGASLGDILGAALKARMEGGEAEDDTEEK